jgi:hypothetical protein
MRLQIYARCSQLETRRFSSRLANGELLAEVDALYDVLTAKGAIQVSLGHRPGNSIIPKEALKARINQSSHN